MAEETTEVKKIKKITKGKKWYTIYAPKVFNEVEIGETIGSIDADMTGRTISMPYSAISNELSKHYIKLSLKVVSANGDKLNTEVVGYELSKPFLQRSVRRRASKLDDFVDVKMGNKNVRVKILAVTAFLANSTQRASLRKAIRSELYLVAKDMEMDKFIQALAQGKVQKEVLKKVKVIFPVKFVEVRKIEILSDKKVKEDFGVLKVEGIKKKESRKEGKKIEIAGFEEESKKEEEKVEKAIEEEEREESTAEEREEVEAKDTGAEEESEEK